MKTRVILSFTTMIVWLSTYTITCQTVYISDKVLNKVFIVTNQRIWKQEDTLYCFSLNQSKQVVRAFQLNELYRHKIQIQDSTILNLKGLITVQDSIVSLLQNKVSLFQQTESLYQQQITLCNKDRDRLTEQNKSLKTLSYVTSTGFVLGMGLLVLLLLR